MENFNWAEFTKRIAIKSDMQTLYDAWTKTAELEKWFLAKAIFKSDIEKVISPNNNAPVNSFYEWNWFAQNYHEEGKLTQANGKDFLEFTFANSLVSVQIVQKSDHVFVELKQYDIPTDEESKKNIRIGCSEGWSHYLLNLKSIYEGGIDLRNKDTEIVGVVNN
jgi:uncharacterized protein YndB with AHSA1/START domain